MREILFRGKRTDNGEWVYGVPVKDNHGETVMVESVYECEEYNCRGANCLYVNENTVEQYTGLTDKNGKTIFEGDIVKGHWGTLFTIFCDEARLQLRTRSQLGIERDIDYYQGYNDIEVIGNIYDNPELLRGEDE